MYLGADLAPRPWLDSAPGHQESQKPSLFSGGFVLCAHCINNSLMLGSYKWGWLILLGRLDYGI